MGVYFVGNTAIPYFSSTVMVDTMKHEFLDVSNGFFVRGAAFLEWRVPQGFRTVQRAKIKGKATLPDGPKNMMDRKATCRDGPKNVMDGQASLRDGPPRRDEWTSNVARRFTSPRWMDKQRCAPVQKTW